MRPAPAPAIYAFADDFVDAGVDDVADHLAALGFAGVALATVYHAARDLLPHNPKRAVAHRDEGAFSFVPDASLYAGALKPPVEQAACAREFGSITTALHRRGVAWQAWTVYLHNCRLATDHPELAVTNAFGDHYITVLCPSSDAVTAYAEQLTADVAQLSPSLIVAESLHHTGFGHGYHHERAFVDVPLSTEFLLSLCFCEACVATAAAAGIDAPALAARVREIVRGSLAGAAMPGLDRASLARLCGDPLLDYLRVREGVVTTLAARCAGVARAAGVPFGFIDQTGALKGYLTGEPQGGPSAGDAWRLGISPAAVAGAVDSYVALAYAKDPARIADDVTAYTRAAAGAVELRCVLRHGGPDYLGPDNLAAKVAAARRGGADAVDFYHYGLMSLSGLDAAAAAARTAAER